MSDAGRGLFDAVVVWRFDRFARSVRQLVLALEEFHSLGIDFVSHQESLDTSTPMGRAMFRPPLQGFGTPLLCCWGSGEPASPSPSQRPACPQFGV
jgi:hypothetical protein